MCMSENKQAILCFFFRYVVYDNSCNTQGNSQSSATTVNTNWDPLRRTYSEVMDDPPDNSDITPIFPSYLGPVTETWLATDSQKTPT
jgi:hypothetical protein